MGVVLLGVFLLALLPFVLVRPQRGLLVLAALVPFHGLLPVLPEGAVPAFWKEALLAVVVLAAAVNTARNGPRGRSATMPWLAPLALFVVLGVASALLVHGPVGLIAVKVSFFYAVLITPVLLLHPFTPRDRDHLVTIMMVVGVVTAAYGIAQQFIGGDTLASWGYRWNDTIRTSGSVLRSFSTFALPFPFGLYCMTVLLVCGSVALADPTRLRNRVFLWCTPVVLAGMAVSIVRGSYLGFVVGVVFLAVVAYRWMRGWVLAGGLVLAGALAAAPAAIRHSVFSSSSLDARSTGWGEILTDLASRPLGQGLGFTGAAADTLAAAEGVTRVPYQPDNYYVKTALELGPLGTALFVAILVLGLLAMMRARRLAPVPADRAFAVGVAAFVVAGAAASFVATFLEIFPLDVYFWLLLGAGTLTVRHEGPARPRTAGGRQPLTAGRTPGSCPSARSPRRDRGRPGG